MKIYRVRERVTFVYTWIVSATDAKQAREICAECGDGEAVAHTEMDRKFFSVRELLKRDLLKSWEKCEGASVPRWDPNGDPSGPIPNDPDEP